MKNPKAAYVISVDMGYGHERAAYPLKDIAVCPKSIPQEGDVAIIRANVYPGIPKIDKRRRESGRKLYETISRFKKVPLLGTGLFALMDYLQRIEPFYPKRNLSKPTAQVKQMYGMIRRGWGKDLIEKLNEDPLPLIATFFTVAFFAEEHGYAGDIYCLCTDTDISRAWAPLDPEKSRICYLAPNKRVRERLILYGVKPSHIFVCGFPLPKENLGNQNLSTLRASIRSRLTNLDPKFRYQKKFASTIEEYIDGTRDKRLEHPLTITFAVGGAGAQRDIGIQILDSLHDQIDAGHVRLNLVAGSRADVFNYYNEEVRRLHLNKKHSGDVNIIYDSDKREYFKKFNAALLTTDILWTKPSELSFYAGLGLPIIMAPTVGSQEEYNKAWLHSIGAGMEQENPKYTHEWLFDWLDSGWFAQAAMEGFLNASRSGVYHIEEIVLHGKRSEIEDVHLL